MLAGLNERQIEAVKTDEGPLLIVAGAGSGKTQVITYKIAYMIAERKAYPSQVLAVTFTNKAAKEMKARVRQLLSNKVPSLELDKMWISTFHSVCARMLRIDGSRLGIPSNFVIYDTADQISMLKKVLKELDIDIKQFKPYPVLDAISSAKNELVSPAEYEKCAFDIFSKKVAQAYPLYQKILQKNNALDFDDLLYYTVALLKDFPEVANKYQERFKYILVDEYQDTNLSQYFLVRTIAKNHSNICVVGDGDQSIYSWRGASTKNFLQFERDFPMAHVVMLEQNYRSTPNILNAANEVIQNNIGRKEKRLWTDKAAGEKVTHYKGFNEREEAVFIAEEIHELMSTGYNAKDFAVLYRTNAQSRIIEDTFIYRKLKYQIVGAYRFYERKEIKDLLAYLRVLNNPNDNYSLNRAIECLTEGLGKASVARLEEYAVQNGVSMFEAMRENAVLKGKTAQTASNFYAVAMELRKVYQEQELELATFIEMVIEKTSFFEALTRNEAKDYEDRVENVKEFVGLTRERGVQKLEEFLIDVALLSDIDESDAKADVVTLMTLHSAKGLEFPVVFIAGMEEGILPHFKSLYSIEDIEEERRLCYVGLTRAKERLYLSSVISRNLYGNLSANEKTRFIKEIDPQHLIERISPRLAGVDKKPSFITASGISLASKKKTEHYVMKDFNSFNYNVGDEVYHKTFGRGQVTYLFGNGMDATLTIKFASDEKTLMLKYAPIEKV